jgi:hypothetical protein
MPFKSYYMPILTYGAEIRTWTEADSNLTAAEMRLLRSIEGKTKRDRIRNKILERIYS